MGLSRWLHERHGAPVWMSDIGHRSTGDYLAASPDALREQQHAFVTAHGMEIELETLRNASGREHGAWYGGLPPLARAAAGGERVHAAGRDWDLIETSGHCRGHLCLYDAQDQVLITGDQVLPTISPNVSVLPSRPDANPLREFLESLARLEHCAPDTLVLPSHGRPFRGLHRRVDVLRSHHLQQLESLREACREPQAAYELLPVMYGRPLRGYPPLPGARRNRRAPELPLARRRSQAYRGRRRPYPFRGWLRELAWNCPQRRSGGCWQGSRSRSNCPPAPSTC